MPWAGLKLAIVCGMTAILSVASAVDAQVPTKVKIRNPTSGPAPLQMRFSADGSPPSEPTLPPAHYSWTFGDGTAAKGQTVTHTYSQAKDYEVTVTYTRSRRAQIDSVVQEDHASDKTIVRVVAPAPGQLQVEPQSLTFATAEGTSPTTQSLTIRNVGGTPLRWSATADSERMKVMPPNGAIGLTKPVRLNVSIDASGLSANQEYALQIMSSDASGDRPTVRVPVTLVVRRLAPVVSTRPSKPSILVPAIVVGAVLAGLCAVIVLVRRRSGGAEEREEPTPEKSGRVRSLEIRFKQKPETAEVESAGGLIAKVAKVESGIAVNPLELTLSHLLELERSSTLYKQLGRALADLVSNAAAGSVPESLEDGLSSEAPVLFNRKILDLCIEGWKKYKEIREFAEKKDGPSDIHEVALMEHEITLEEEPELEVRFNGALVGRVTFKFEVCLTLEGVLLIIQEGKIKRVRLGRCQCEATLSVGPLSLKAEGKKMMVGPEIELGDGITL
jgi:hypothetical protein